MKRRFLSLILSVTVIFSCMGFALSSSAIESNNNSSSVSAPEGYVPSVGDVSIDLMAEDTDANVLLVQDVLPWDSYANETVLNALDISYDKITTTQMSMVDLTQYEVAIIANDQPIDTYGNYKELQSQIDMFVNLGGVLIFGACDNGWANGNFDFELPGGVRKVLTFAENNYIVDYSNPIITAELSDGISLTDNDLYSNYCSHTSFLEETLPEGTNIITRAQDDGRPTLIEYPVGSGYVIASGLTWEHSYNMHYGNDYYGMYGRKALDDLFLYAFEKIGAVEAKDKMQISRDNNNFGHNVDSFFSNGQGREAGYIISDKYFNKLLSYYKNTWFENVMSVFGVKNQLQKARESWWGGSCHGISTSMALAFIGEIDLENFTTNTNESKNYYSMKAPNKNSYFRDVINYYQLSQYLQIIDDNSTTVFESDSVAFSGELEKIVSLAKQSEKSGYPFLFSFGWNYGGSNTAGHTIVCVGCEETRNGYRLQFVDPNETSDYIYANVNSGFDTIAFETIYNSRGYAGFDLTRIGHEYLSNYNKIDIDGAGNDISMCSVEPNGFVEGLSNVDVIVFNSRSAFELVTSNGKTLRFENGELTGSLSVLNVNCVEMGEYADYQIMVPNSYSYSITPLTNDIDISIYSTQGEYCAFAGTNAQSISFAMGGGVEATGSNMTYTAYYGVQGKNTEMVSVKNTDADNIKIEDAYGEVKIDGTNLDEAEVSVYLDNIVYCPETEVSDDGIIVSKDNDINLIADIKTPSQTEIVYGDTLVLHAEFNYIPEGAEILWFAEGTGVSLQVNEDSTSCYVTSVEKGQVRVSVALVNEDGEILTNEDGDEVSDSIELTSKVNIFWKIISFFKDLFRISRVILMGE